MKKLRILFIPLLFCFMTLTGCFVGHEGCGDDCVNGECADGTCVCDQGYEGTICDIPVNAKFNGHYHATQVCWDTTNALSDTILVAPFPSTLDRVNITGLWELPQNNVVVNVKGDGVTLEILRQSISASHEISATGMSNASGTMINLTYQIYAQGDSTVLDHCQATLQR